MNNALKTADWPHREGLKLLTQTLGADNIRWVGGAVRDALLEAEVHDIDCATTLTPDVVIDRCASAGIRTVPTGIDHGTVTAVLDDGPVEVTTLRLDVATDGRRATVAFATDWRDDAARRDFTINALYAHPETLEISDYFGGLADLEARCVRFIGEARERIAEDHLRILRYYRFQARFGAELDAEAEEACADMAASLKGLSRERVADELLRLLALPDPGPTVARMFERGVLRVILPEACAVHVEALKSLIVQEAEQTIAPDPVRRLASLLPPSPDVAEAVAARLRLSKAQRARLVSAAERTASDADDPKALAYRITSPFAVDRLLLLGSSVEALTDWNPPEFPLKGGEIVARGVQAGPEVARILQTAERQWVAEGFPPQSRVTAILDAILKKS
ncbi:CCA tRNA nucleotidyltransferase [Erythrobacter sp. SCSIO 43205]|uniref:CCA tRNA nucleotidyltransferase n=1 Tax=Erythrobacter sp. SCSIO 43205 TaxID=2779361 RepID=UPI001CA94123|nr:CCA tRNA nucleotidyltransferase [Erythrobacter sp. SCSIO 43205]UAB79425.1 CCA tRNA nucleotidyltransferase [Erythrobacter sp. SCSIO 43205]